MTVNTCSMLQKIKTLEKKRYINDYGLKITINKKYFLCIKRIMWR